MNVPRDPVFRRQSNGMKIFTAVAVSELTGVGSLAML
jgi:hypothetical protein